MLSSRHSTEEQGSGLVGLLAREEASLCILKQRHVALGKNPDFYVPHFLCIVTKVRSLRLVPQGVEDRLN